MSSLEPAYWRSLQSPSTAGGDEFPSRAEGLSRREALCSLSAMAALAGCTKQPVERILPYVRQPEEIIPGNPLFFATAMPFRGGAVGLLAESHEGRPIKLEGNPTHPGSLGRTFPWHQAAIYDLYDPDRLKTVMWKGAIGGWGPFLNAVSELKRTLGDGAGLHILSEVLHSPTLLAQVEELRAAYPAMQWHEYDSIGGENGIEGATLAFGRPLDTIYRFDEADVVVALDADFFYGLGGSLVYARQFTARRRAQADRRTMNRLYVVEPCLTVTGAKADHRLAVKAAMVETISRALAAELKVGDGAVESPPQFQSFIAAMAADLRAHPGRGVVIAGEDQPASVHVLAHAINDALGNSGRTVLRAEGRGSAGGLRALAAAMNRGAVKALFILGGNPVYDAPADLNFSRAMDRVPFRMSLSLANDETGERCQWQIPQAHFLEGWSDARAYDGTASIVQPLIDPLYDGKTAHEVVATLSANPDRSGYSIVRDYWRAQRPAEDFDRFWDRCLHDGVVPGTALPLVDAKASLASLGAAPKPRDGLEVVFKPDPNIWDGRFANNGWLQECPKPLTKLTWDNVVHLSPGTAARLGIASEDVVTLGAGDRRIKGAAWITPGQADDCAVVTLGYGRRRTGRWGIAKGFDANTIRPSASPHFAYGLIIEKTSERYRLACTQDHPSTEGRNIIRAGDNAAFLANPSLFDTKEREHHEEALSIYPEVKYEGHRWGMSIDQTSCIGCNACVIACQAENNIATVGRDEVLKGREMHWIRIDRYFSGSSAKPQVHFQPMLCQHCERAPCEPVCPVAATVHSGEGLSQMIYNRCVGTRYCSNNCPYKVRRFNFLLYSDWNSASLAPMRNPDVSVRSRGVMEKCSFCTQRIEEARIVSKREGRVLRDGDVVSACQGACPTDAIVFGDLNDRASQVSKLHENKLSYSVLSELGTKPRIRYQAELRNRAPGVDA